MMENKEDDEKMEQRKRIEEGPVLVDDLISYAGFGKYQLMVMVMVGLVWMIDSMEIMLLTFLGPALSCSWGISSSSESLISTVMFLGMMLGKFFIGSFSDSHGRKVGFLFVGVMVLFFGTLSAFSFSLWFLLLMRFFVGFGTGGGDAAFTLFSEVLPIHARAKSLMAIEIFWAVGAFAEAVLAWLVLPTLGWRWFLLFSVLPFLSIIAIYPLVPESPRYLLLHGKVEQSKKELKRMFVMNGCDPDLVEKADLRLNMGEQENEKGEEEEKRKGERVHERFEEEIKEVTAEEMGIEETSVDKFSKAIKNVALLFGPEVRLTTSALSVVWFMNCFVYYGMVLIVTVLFEQEDEGNRCPSPSPPSPSPFHLERISPSSRLFDMESETCIGDSLSTRDFLDIIITTTAEFPGVVVVAFFLDIFGRKKTQSFCLFLEGLLLLSLLFCSGRNIETAILWLARGTIAGTFQATYAYTPEAFPTLLRSSGLGWCAAFSRLGGMFAPFIVYEFQEEVYISLIALGVASIVGSITILIPRETAGESLTDTLVKKEEQVEEKKDQSLLNSSYDPL